MNVVQPLPTAWCEAVIRILSNGTREEIRWSIQAQMDWQQFGMPYEANALIVKTLQQPGIWGEQIIGMVPLPNPPKNAGKQAIFAFLCAHPLGFPKPLYAKIGLFDNRVTIDLFSLHIDRSGELTKKIAKAQKKKP